MLAFPIALMGVLFAAAGAASAQGVRISSYHPNSSMTFHQYLEPFPRFSNAAACRDACVANPRCTGWTWYDNSPSHPEVIRLTCILGTGLKHSIIGRAPGRAAGLVTVRARKSSFHANSSMTFYQYFEPFPRVNSAIACRDICIGNPRCTGWTWYQDLAANDTLRRACILGAGLKSSKIGNKPGRISGLIR